MKNTPEKTEARQEIREAIEKLSNIEISYGIALSLNHKYDHGGYSVSRSERSFLLDMYFRLNREKQSKVADINPFEHGDLFIEEAKSRVRENHTGSRINIDLNNPQDLSCMILRLWILHYREKMEGLGDGGYQGSDVDYSFQSEIQRAELVYTLYIQEQDVAEDTLDTACTSFINEHETDTWRKYKLELGWKVDDLTKDDFQG